jgi:hypothetical protein
MWPGCSSRIETVGGLSRYLVFQFSVPASRVAWEADLSLAPTARRTRRVNSLNCSLPSGTPDTAIHAWLPELVSWMMKAARRTRSICSWLLRSASNPLI